MCGFGFFRFSGFLGFGFSMDMDEVVKVEALFSF